MQPKEILISLLEKAEHTNSIDFIAPDFARAMQEAEFAAKDTDLPTSLDQCRKNLPILADASAETVGNYLCSFWQYNAYSGDTEAVRTHIIRVLEILISKY